MSRIDDKYGNLRRLLGGGVPTAFNIFQNRNQPPSRGREITDELMARMERSRAKKKAKRAEDKVRRLQARQDEIARLQEMVGPELKAEATRRGGTLEIGPVPQTPDLSSLLPAQRGFQRGFGGITDEQMQRHAQFKQQYPGTMRLGQENILRQPTYAKADEARQFLSQLLGGEIQTPAPGRIPEEVQRGELEITPSILDRIMSTPMEGRVAEAEKAAGLATTKREAAEQAYTDISQREPEEVEKTIESIFQEMRKNPRYKDHSNKVLWGLASEQISNILKRRDLDIREKALGGETRRQEMSEVDIALGAMKGWGEGEGNIGRTPSQLVELYGNRYEQTFGKLPPTLSALIPTPVSTAPTPVSTPPLPPLPSIGPKSGEILPKTDRGGISKRRETPGAGGVRIRERNPRLMNIIETSETVSSFTDKVEELIKDRTLTEADLPDLQIELRDRFSKDIKLNEKAWLNRNPILDFIMGEDLRSEYSWGRKIEKGQKITLQNLIKIIKDAERKLEKEKDELFGS